MHVSGERLSQLTGIAAILRFPMPDLDLADDHNHHEMNSEQQSLNNDNLELNSCRNANNLDDNDDHQSTNNYRTLNENRAEASAW